MNEATPDINKVLFMHLVSMLAMSAIQQMGKLVNPGTGKAEINLDAAQATIDMLDMLFTKTKNNLDADEEKMMKDTLASLKINFVETKDAEDRKPKKPDGGQRTTDGGPAKAGGGTEKQTSNTQRPTPNSQPHYDITVVIVSHNDLNEACLASLDRARKASHLNIGVVVVDNASVSYDAAKIAALRDGGAVK